ncbi:MAG TPA: 16S rRNA (guanine(966)-N(2))-methyltransferase RsmD [Candidatus Melainabacteria bacterium]|nr:16S rRNA (guanine(966)-N(2))-methyltransferase RsmD [Candidatus Melainabacteria bacterium]
MRKLRITGGTARGRSVESPVGLEIRPTGAKVRQALFNILAWRMNGARFLDICAGTGLIGIEALSRGAGSLISVEENRAVAKAVENSLRKLKLDGEVICGDWRRVLPILEPKSFDIIFADPPYKSPHIKEIPLSVEKYDLLDEGGLLVIEHLKGYKFSDDCTVLALQSTRNYGQTSLSFFSKSEENQ